jgi:hypothetical protein
MRADTAIPRIIHQTWKTREVPDKWKGFHESWKKHHPEWRHVLWTDEDNMKFIEEHFPEFFATFTAYSYPIQRVDAVRYFILYKYGGVYADLDIECLRPIGPLLDSRSFVLGYEPAEHARGHGERSMICNAFMASVPTHPFLEETISALKKINPKIRDHREVLTTTGPLMLSRVLREYHGGDVTVLGDEVLYPLTNDSRDRDNLIHGDDASASIKRRCAERGAYAIHYWSNTWVRDLAGPLRNADPFNVKGYRFYPGLDSSGHDILNAGRDIGGLAEECGKDQKARGFNTDGFLKHRIRPTYDWVTIKDAGGNEGLYVKNSHLPSLWLRSLTLFRFWGRAKKARRGGARGK